MENTDNYCLEVNDFGPIVRAKVEVKPLTIFIGPSNTGKSYLATLIYALHQSFSKKAPEQPIAFPWTEEFNTPDHRTIPHPLFPGTEKSEIELAQKAIVWLKTIKAEAPLSSAPPREVESGFLHYLRRADGLDVALENQLCRCFGIQTPKELVRYPKNSSGTTLVNINLPQKQTKPIYYQFKADRVINKRKLSGHFPEIVTPLFESIGRDIAIPELKWWAQKDDPDSSPLLLFFLTNTLFKEIVQPLLHQCYYLPADRTGVMHTNQALVGTLIQNATMSGLQLSQAAPTLSGVFADFLTQLIDIGVAHSSPEKVPQASPSLSLERDMLGGEIILNRPQTGLPIYAYRPHDWGKDLPLMRVSSMVSELAPVILYLRYVVKENDILIIEEPEAHLHPAMQAAFARELAWLVRSGIRIVITTHSEWFLEQIGNLVRLSELPVDKRAAIMDRDVSLNVHDVGAWLFKPNPDSAEKGSVVNEVKLDPETGLFPTDYDEISKTLYNEGAQIFNKLQGESA